MPYSAEKVQESYLNNLRKQLILKVPPKKKTVAITGWFLLYHKQAKYFYESNTRLQAYNSQQISF